MTEWLSRTELLISKDGIEKLNSSRVAVFGAGGVGSYAIEALARSGVGTIDIIDNDKIAPSNINRQLYALVSTIGQYKVDVAKARALDINPNIKINISKTFFMPETSSEFDFRQYDYVIDAIDTVTGKIELIIKSNEANTPVISSMGAGNKLNPTMFEVADIFKTSICPLAKVMRQELKKRGIKSLKVVYSKETPIKPNTPQTHKAPASIAFVPSVVGLIIASEVIKDLTGAKNV